MMESRNIDFGPLQSQLDILTQSIRQKPGIEALILFGSCARNSGVNVNDIDILILVKDTSVDIESITSSIRKEIFLLLTLPVDIIVESREDFDARKKLPTLERTIDREGIILYAA